MSGPVQGENGGLRRVFEAAAKRAGETGGAQWVVWTLPWADVDPLAWFAAQPAEERFFWQWREAGEAIAAHGVAHEIEASGPERFEVVGDRIAALRADVLHHYDAEPMANSVAGESPTPLPLWLGGFGFEHEPSPDPDWKAFPPARWVLPKLSLSLRNGRCHLRVVHRVDAGADPERELKRARRALRAALARFDRHGRLDADADDLQPCDPEPARSTGPGAANAPVHEWGPGPEYRVQADRSHRTYRGQVADALHEIAEGRLEKVVLARSLRIVHDGPLALAPFLRRLRDSYPSCVVLAVGRGDDILVAATPEPLVRLRGRDVEAAALAGSAPRGRTPEEDAAFGAALLASQKERAEHSIVVREILRVLTAHCTDCSAPAEPTLRRVEGIQHLETPIRARLGSASREQTAGTQDLLSLASRLHPTPAVGGTPRLAAAEWVRAHEGLARGWYAGPVGWVDEAGGGHLRVALRSALIRHSGGPDATSDYARLFAGAGIVDGSTPAGELDETRIKLRALLAPLTEI